MQLDNILWELSQSKSATNRLAKGLTAEELETLINNLQSALSASKKRQAKRNAQKRAANLKKLKAMMVRMGVSTEDVKHLIMDQPQGKSVKQRKTSPKSKCAAPKIRKVAPKYQIKVGKQTHKWTGRGRMPLVFKEFLEKGGSLDTCLIKKPK